MCKLRFVLEDRCEPPPKSSVRPKCNADLATLLILEKRDALLVWTQCCPEHFLFILFITYTDCAFLNLVFVDFTSVSNLKVDA